MLKSMTESGPAINEDDVAVLERSIGVYLPHDYRAFLLKYNGGRPSPYGFPIEGLANNPYGALHFFFGINDEIESCNLDWNHDVMEGRLPANLLPIASDHSGNLICLSLFGNDAGSVLFWDYYQETGEPTYHNIYRVANTFAEFLENLQELSNSE